jgi:aminopeptidase N
MLHTLLGADDFRRGTDLYFERHDGQAVTTEDFVRALEDASGRSFEQFRRWYSQSGTPVVSIQRAYDPAARTCALTISQRCPPTPGQADKDPFHIPLKLSLLDPQGQALPLQLYGESAAAGTERVLEICEAEETFVFQNIPAEPVPSLLRGFSAPVRLEIDYSEEELAFLLANDTDPFARWEAGQRLARSVVFAVLDARRAGTEPVLPAGFVHAVQSLLEEQGDDAFLAECLALPSENYLAEFMEVVDPVALHEARQWVRRTLAARLRDAFAAGYQCRAGGAYALSAAEIGTRALRNLCLQYLVSLETPEMYALAEAQYQQADNMTDRLAALAALVNSQSPERTRWLEDFYATWQHEPLVVDKWLSLQATAQHPDTLDHVRALVEHPAFSLSNPNKVYALLRAFGSANPAQFHATGGNGYRFLGEQLKRLDAINPQVAARVVSAFTSWRRYDTERQREMKAVLEDLLSISSLSKDLVEIITKTLS